MPEPDLQDRKPELAHFALSGACIGIAYNGREFTVK